MNDYIKLAKSTIETYIKTGKVISPPDDLPAEMLSQKAGVFVSIHKKDGSLRGCIGTFIPTQKNIAQEIIANAIAAATQDPRFPPITKEKLPNLEVSVDILSKPKLVKDTSKMANFLDPRSGIRSEETLADSESQRKKRQPRRPPPRWRNALNPKHYGLIVSTADGRKGLLLPDIPGVETPEQQIAICRRKAGIGPKEPVKLDVFTVERHSE